MDVFYEESSVSSNAKKGEKRYKILNAISYVFLVLWILLLVFAIQWFPIKQSEEYAGLMSMFLLFLWLAVTFFFLWFFIDSG